MRILVTGGCGFVGANLIRSLLERQYDVVVVDNLSAGRREYLNGLDVAIVVGDVRDPSGWKRLLHEGDAIIHLAAHTGVPDSITNPSEDFDVNVGGTLAVLMAARECGVQRFIFASSNAPLGRQQPPASEGKPALPLSPYGASKLAGEGYCLAFYGSYGLSTVALRFSNVYGPFAGHKESVVAKFLSDAMQKRRLTITGDGSQTRDLIHVSDIVQGIILALEHNEVSGEIIQLGTGVETSIITLAHQIKALVPFDVELSFKPAQIGEIVRNYSNIEKARRLLGFSPTMPLQEGLRQTVDWFVSAKPEAIDG